MIRRLEILRALLLYSLIATISLSVSHKDASILCSTKERNALLAFRQELTDGSGRLSSWVGDNCCTWTGVYCDTTTGSVFNLNLRNPFDTYDNQNWEASLGGKINPSLLELKNLKSLDLSMNYFNGTIIPEFIGSLQQLQFLNLSEAFFSGKIPVHLGNLSKLRVLDLSENHMAVNLVSENLQWLSNLSHLEHLDLSNVNLTKASNWLEIISTIPSLLELRLSNCELRNFPPIKYLNLTSLEVLDLSWNNLNSSLPNWLYSLNNLKYLNLFNNKVCGTLSSSIGNLTSLTSLILNYNYLEGEVPESLGNLCQLKEINLENNKFRGDVSGFLTSLSHCQPTKLRSISLVHNQLSGLLPREVGNLTNLEVLDLSSNAFSGHILESMGNLTNLEFLKLTYNAFSGPIPESIGKLSNLELLDLRGNLFEGIITETHLNNLTSLVHLDASKNLLVIEVQSSWTPKFQLTNLDLEFVKLGPNFPSWLRTQNSLEMISLSNANISDEIPKWFWNISSFAGWIDISNNHIRGELPSIMNFRSSSTQIFLHSNNLSGRLPRLSYDVIELNLSNNLFSGNLSFLLCNPPNKTNNLENIDLSNNFLSGEFPRCAMYAPFLHLIKLNNNNLTGTIPSSLGFVEDMSIFDVRNNSMSGELPSSLQSWKRLASIDLGWNEFSGNISTWIGNESPYFKLLGLHSNKFSGEIPKKLCHFTTLRMLDIADNNLSGRLPRCLINISAMANQTYESYDLSSGNMKETSQFASKGLVREYSNYLLSLLTTIDVSHNNLSGEIPSELTKLLGLRFLNLSGNSFTGRIPKEIGAMGLLLESLDLSGNRLTGFIPQSMSNLTTLSCLNLSFNNITGPIPTGPQLQIFDELSYIGNDGLCGPPLRVLCQGKSSGETSTTEDGATYNIMEQFYVTFGPGVVVGFIGFFAYLVFLDSWRIAYFQFIEAMVLKRCACF